MSYFAVRLTIWSNNALPRLVATNSCPLRMIRPRWRVGRRCRQWLPAAPPLRHHSRARSRHRSYEDAFIVDSCRCAIRSVGLERSSKYRNSAVEARHAGTDHSPALPGFESNNGIRTGEAMERDTTGLGRKNPLQLQQLGRSLALFLHGESCFAVSLPPSGRHWIAGDR